MPSAQHAGITLCLVQARGLRVYTFAQRRHFLLGQLDLRLQRPFRVHVALDHLGLPLRTACPCALFCIQCIFGSHSRKVLVVRLGLFRRKSQNLVFEARHVGDPRLGLAFQLVVGSAQSVDLITQHRTRRVSCLQAPLQRGDVDIAWRRRIRLRRLPQGPELALETRDLSLHRCHALVLGRQE